MEANTTASDRRCMRRPQGEADYPIILSAGDADKVRKTMARATGGDRPEWLVIRTGTVVTADTLGSGITNGRALDSHGPCHASLAVPDGRRPVRPPPPSRP